MTNFNQGDVYAAAIVLPCLATVAVALRFYVRNMKSAGFKGDDWAVLMGLILTWATGIVMIIGAANGSIGTHTAFDPVTGKQISTETSNMTAKLYFTFMLCFVLAIGLIKFSVLLLYRRIFISKSARLVSTGLSVFVGIWTLAFFLARIFECGSHVSAAWDPLRIRMYCLAQQSIDTAFAASDVATDLMVLASPLPFIWQLKMSTAHKISVTCIFMLGLLATAAGTARLAFVVIFDYKSVTGHRDVQAIGTIQVMWAQIEAGVACIAACLPTFRPLVGRSSPESLLRGARSRFSLHSKDSNSQKRSDTESEKYNHGFRLTPHHGSRQSTIVGGSTVNVGGAEVKVPQGSILVSNSVLQESVSKEQV